MELIKKIQTFWINNSFSEFFSNNYDFIIDNDLKTLDTIRLILPLITNFSTNFNYIGKTILLETQMQ